MKRPDLSLDPESEHEFKNMLRQIERLLPDERAQAVQALVSCVLLGLSRAQIGLMRTDLVEEFGADGEFIMLLDDTLARPEI